MSVERERGQNDSTKQARANLPDQYRAIGIGAVAAAVHFIREQKNGAYAPAPAKPVERRYLDQAA